MDQESPWSCSPWALGRHSQRRCLCGITERGQQPWQQRVLARSHSPAAEPQNPPKMLLLVLPCRDQLAQALLLILQSCGRVCSRAPQFLSLSMQGMHLVLLPLWYPPLLWDCFQRAQDLVNHPLQLQSLSEKCKVQRRLQQPHKLEQNLLFIGLSIFTSQLRIKASLEQHLFPRVLLAGCSISSSTWKQHGLKQEEEQSPALSVEEFSPQTPWLFSFIAFLFSEQPEGTAPRCAGGDHSCVTATEPTAHSAAPAVLTLTDLKPRGKILPQNWGNCKEDQFPSWNSNPLKAVSPSGSSWQNNSYSDTQ